MRFEETQIPGVFVIDQQRREDDRGYFARSWCEREFREHGLNPQVVQCNVGFSGQKGTLRGMHFQSDPHAEAKLVRCTAGAVFDVALDLRPGSATYLQWFGIELNQRNGRMLYVPEGCAHGYQTLEDDSEILYQTSHAYAPESATGVRFDDPAFGIQWPLPISSVSEADLNWPAYDSILLTSDTSTSGFPV